MDNAELTTMKQQTKEAFLNARVPITLKNNPPLLGLAQIIIPEVFEVNGIRISESKHDDVWVQFPTFRTGRGYSNAIYFLDKDLTKQMEQRVKEEYFAAYDAENMGFNSEERSV